MSGRDDELQLGEGLLERGDQADLPAWVQVEIELVDQHQALHVFGQQCWRGIGGGVVVPDEVPDHVCEPREGRLVSVRKPGRRQGVRALADLDFERWTRREWLDVGRSHSNVAYVWHEFRLTEQDLTEGCEVAVCGGLAVLLFEVVREVQGDQVVGTVEERATAGEDSIASVPLSTPHERTPDAVPRDEPVGTQLLPCGGERRFVEGVNLEAVVA